MEVFSIPESEEDLISEIEFCQKNKLPFRILGGGSNVLVDDAGLQGFVIETDPALNFFKQEENRVEVGAGTPLQKFILFCIANNLYGNEFLFSVPGKVGGAIFMNAGTGKKESRSISDFLVSVRIFDGERIFEIPKEKCGFSYRKSIFQKNRKWTILSAVFNLPSQKKELGEERIRERARFAQKFQDTSLPCAGSVFSKSSIFATLLLKYAFPGLQKGGAQYAKNSGNWIHNVKNAKSSDVLFLIRVKKILSWIFLCPPKVEIDIWRDE